MSSQYFIKCNGVTSIYYPESVDKAVLQRSLANEFNRIRDLCIKNKMSIEESSEHAKNNVLLEKDGNKLQVSWEFNQDGSAKSSEIES